MTDHKPLLVVPRTADLSHAFDDDLASIRVSGRAVRTGIAVIAPRATPPTSLMVACQLWPFVLMPLCVTRVAVVLGVQTFMLGEPLLPACVRSMKAHRLTVAYFHEGHLESDAIEAWFEQRKPRRRISSDTMIKLSEQYAARGDVRGAFHAIELAEKLAG